MFGYATTIRTLTQGRGSFTMHYEGCEAVLCAVLEEIIAARKEAKEEQLKT